MNNLKADFYRFYHSKSLLINLLVILVYTCLVYLLYHLDHLPYYEILINFNDEYHLLFIILTFSFASSIITTEVANLTIDNYPRKNLIKIKCLEIFIDIILVIITTFLVNIIILGLLDIHSFTKINLFKIFINNYKVLYEYIFLNFIVLFLNCFSKSSTKVLIMAYLIYIVYNYAKTYIIRFKIKQLYFLCFLNQISVEYEVLKSQLNYEVYSLIFIVTILFIYYLTNLLIKKQRN